MQALACSRRLRRCLRHWGRLLPQLATLQTPPQTQLAAPAAAAPLRGAPLSRAGSRLHSRRSSTGGPIKLDGAAPRGSPGQPTAGSGSCTASTAPCASSQALATAHGSLCYSTVPPPCSCLLMCTSAQPGASSPLHAFSLPAALDGCPPTLPCPPLMLLCPCLAPSVMFLLLLCHVLGPVCHTCVWINSLQGAKCFATS